MQPAVLPRQVSVHDAWTRQQSSSHKALSPGQSSPSGLAARAPGPQLNCSAFSLLIAPAAMLGSSLRRRRPGVGLKAKKKEWFLKKFGGISWDKEAGRGYKISKIILELDQVVELDQKDGTPTLKNFSLDMHLGAKIGIPGRSGSGKRTVMRILGGKDDKFLGYLTLTSEKGIRVGHLEKEPIIKEKTVIECLEKAVKPIKQMVQDFEDVSIKMTDPDADMDALMVEMDKLQSQIDAADAYNLDSKLDQVMEALRCPPWYARIETLSGGERRRVAICRLLLSNPDILFLDEPTKHLDAQSVAWLERYLFEFKGTVVAFTLDRLFLDNVAGWILDLDQGRQDAESLADLLYCVPISIKSPWTRRLSQHDITDLPSGHGDGCPDIEWDRKGRCFAFVVDPKRLADVVNGRKTLTGSLEHELKPILDKVAP